MDKIYISELFERNLDRAISTGELDEIAQAKKWTDEILAYLKSKTDVTVEDDDIAYKEQTFEFVKGDPYVEYVCTHKPSGIKGIARTPGYAREDMITKLIELKEKSNV